MGCPHAHQGMLTWLVEHCSPLFELLGEVGDFFSFCHNGFLIFYTNNITGFFVKSRGFFKKMNFFYASPAQCLCGLARGMLPRRPPARSMTGLAARWGLKVNIYSIISTTKQRSPPKLIATIAENNISAIILKYDRFRVLKCGSVFLF